MLEWFSRWLQRYQGIEANPIYRLAADVATGRISLERALDAAQSYQINGRLADGDLIELDHQVEFEAHTSVSFALTLGRLNAAAARAKGFDKVMVDLYLRVADLLRRDDQEPEREYYLRDALLTAQRISYVNGQRRALNRLARIAFERGDTEMARDLLIQQLDAGREESDSRDEIDTAVLLADIALSDGDVASAHDLYHRAARSARRIGFFSGAVDALLRQVSILRERNDLQGCLILLKQASDAADHTDDAALQAEVAFRTGTLMRELDMPEEAAERLGVALDRARVIGDLSLESRTLSILANLEDQLKRDTSALQHYEEMAALESRLGNRPDVARAQLAMGQLYLTHKRYHEAIVTLTEASDYARHMNDATFSAQANGLLGRALMMQGREAEALNALEIAVRDSRSLGDVAEEARWLIAAGEAMLRSGETSNATALADRAEELAHITDDNALRSEVYNLVGQVALVEHRLQDAEDAFTSATAAARAAGKRGEAAHYLPLLARVASQMRDVTGALRYLDLAIADAEAAHERQRIPALQLQAARLLSKNGRNKEAEQRYTAAADVAEEVGDPRTSGHALLGIGALYDQTDDFDTALSFYRDALQYALVADDKQTATMAHFNIGAVLVDLNRDDEARTHLTQARDLAESIRNAALAENARALLHSLTPAPVPYNPFEDDSSDFPISEEPSRPRNDQQLH